MSEQADWDDVQSIVDNYVQMVQAELSERWNLWSIDLVNREMYEVIGALLARQVTLTTQLVNAPTIWNGHIAPLILRTMTDTYITLAWIFCDPLDRAQKFILHGLGQEKLQIEHRKADLESRGINAEEDLLVQAKEAWLNSQRYSFLTEVNIGSWSGIDTRKMAQEAGCIELYNYAYAPFSAATHSMWHHISRYNLVTCSNPLHGYHHTPVDTPVDAVDPDYFYRAAKYVEKSFNLFDEKTGIQVNVPSSFQALVEGFGRLSRTDTQNAHE